jgi:hypothetical protein
MLDWLIAFVVLVYAFSLFTFLYSWLPVRRPPLATDRRDGSTGSRAHP